MAKIYKIKKHKKCTSLHGSEAVFTPRKTPERTFTKGGELHVRDFRDKGFFMVDDRYLNGWIKICGRTAAVVYFVLCRHANTEQSCWPHIETIAEKVGASERTIKRAIRKLASHKIIAIGRKSDGSNYYDLLDKSCWITRIVSEPRV